MGTKLRLRRSFATHRFFLASARPDELDSLPGTNVAGGT